MLFFYLSHALTLYLSVHQTTSRVTSLMDSLNRNATERSSALLSALGVRLSISVFVPLLSLSLSLSYLYSFCHQIDWNSFPDLFSRLNEAPLAYNDWFCKSIFPEIAAIRAVNMNIYIHTHT